MYWSWQRRRRNVDWKRSSTSCCQTSRVDSASTCRTCCMDRRANDRRGSLRIYSSFLIRLNTLMTQTRPSLPWHDDCCVADLPCLRWFDVVGYVGRNIQARYRHSNCVCGEHFWGLETPKCVCWDDENISIGFCCDVVYDRKVSSWDVKTVCSGLFMAEKCRAEMWRPSAVDSARRVHDREPADLPLNMWDSSLSSWMSQPPKWWWWWWWWWWRDIVAETVSNAVASRGCICTRVLYKSGYLLLLSFPLLLWHCWWRLLD